MDPGKALSLGQRNQPTLEIPLAWVERYKMFRKNLKNHKESLTRMDTLNTLPILEKEPLVEVPLKNPVGLS